MLRNLQNFCDNRRNIPHALTELSSTNKR